MSGEAQAIVWALHRRGMSDGAIAALCGLTRVTIQRIRTGEQSGRNSLAVLRSIASASMPDRFGPVELDVPAMPRAPRVSPRRTASRERARIFKTIGRTLAPTRTASARPTPPPTPPTPPTPVERPLERLAALQGIHTGADGRVDTSALIARVTGMAGAIANVPARVSPSRGGAGRGAVWCADCPFRPQAPVGTPEYAAQRLSFSCPHYAGRGCTRGS